MKHIIEHIQSLQNEIVSELLLEIKAMQKSDEVIDISAIEKEIEKFSAKKRKAIDLMIEGLISKEDLKEQNALYDSEIAKLTEEISQSRNINFVHQKQIDNVRNYIAEVGKTAEIKSDDVTLYGELLKQIVVHENSTVDFYLHCVPFGFRINYTKKLDYKKNREISISVNSFNVIE